MRVCEWVMPFRPVLCRPSPSFILWSLLSPLWRLVIKSQEESRPFNFGGGGVVLVLGKKWLNVLFTCWCCFFEDRSSSENPLFTATICNSLRRAFSVILLLVRSGAVFRHVFLGVFCEVYKKLDWYALLAKDEMKCYWHQNLNLCVSNFNFSIEIYRKV